MRPKAKKLETKETHTHKKMTDTKVLANSVIGYPESLGLFSRPLQNLGIRHTKRVEYLPVNDMTAQSVIIFEVKSSGASYIDLSKTLLRVTAKIVNADGSTVKDFVEAVKQSKSEQAKKSKVNNSDTATSGSAASASATAADDSVTNKGSSTSSTSDGVSGTQGTGEGSKEEDQEELPGIVAPCQNFMHAIFERVDVMLQNNLVTDSEVTYGYTAFFKALQASPEQKKSIMQMQMYFENENETSDEYPANWTMSEDPNFRKRGKIFAKSREVTMCGKIASSIFDVERLLIYGVPLKIVLYPSQPDFCLISPDTNPRPDFKVVITKAVLEVTHVDVAPEILAAHTEILKTEPCLYPFTKTETKLFAIAQNSYSAEINSPYDGRVPSQLIMGLCDAESVHGSYNKDCFKFEHCNLRSIQCIVDGSDVGQSPIYTKYGDTAFESSYIEGYNSLRGFGGIQNIAPFGLFAYHNGLTLYRFVIEEQESGTVSQGDVIPLQRTGNIRLKLQFDKPLKNPKTLIVFGLFASGFKIDRNRAVHVL